MPNPLFLSQLEQDLVEIDQRLLAIINRYRHVVQRLEDETEGPWVKPVRSRLDELETDHKKFKKALEARNLLPHAPETDLEDLKRAAASVRAWIENDQTQALLNWLIETEQDWQQTLSTFETSKLQDTEIERLRANAREAIDALSGTMDAEP